VKSKPAVLSLLLAASLLTAVRAGASPTPTELFAFNGANGQDPTKLIQASDGNLYGITYLYTYRQGGTVFKLTPAAQFTQLFATHPSPNDASFFPDGNFFGDLTEGSDGFLYVAAGSGGPFTTANGIPLNAGTLLRISKSGAGFEIAHAFCSSGPPGCADGMGPTSIVPGLDGNLYGTTSKGGGCSTCGVVFRFSPASGTYTVLHSVAIGESSPGGLNPANDGNFYATCTSPQGGPPSICRVSTSGQITRIFQFPQPLWPANGTLSQGSNGLLYGVALVNPNSNSVQTVFQLDTSGGSFEQIFQTQIQCCVKIGHSTVIQATDGNLWVTNPNAQLWGTVYTITPTGTLLQTLAFSGSTNGAAPHFLLQASSGVIYGTTYNRGPGGSGTVFSINAGLPPK
jgi:uncharacterized repeat protein (TIGR03803 family)